MKKPFLLWRAMTAVCVVYAGLFAGYAAAYLLLVEREYPPRGAFRCLFAASEPVPRYWVGGRTVYRVFAPAHSLDRRLRPDYWAAEPSISIAPVGAADRSPWRKPWEKCRYKIPSPGRGDRSLQIPSRAENFCRPCRGFRASMEPDPTADAVGYDLPPLPGLKTKMSRFE